MVNKKNIVHIYINKIIFILIVLIISSILIFFCWDNEIVSNTIFSKIYLFIFSFLVVYIVCCTIRIFFNFVLYYLTQRKYNNFLFSQYKNCKLPRNLPRVIILYPTCDDFIEGCAIFAKNQDYANTNFFILDDSKTNEYKNKIDLFSKKYNINVVRRNEHPNWKQTG
jgi:hypothetical protein